jgi:hypothetical protein
LPGFSVISSSGSGVGAVRRLKNSDFGIIEEKTISINSFENSFEKCIKVSNLDEEENKLSKRIENFYLCITFVKSYESTTIIDFATWKAREGHESYAHNLKAPLTQIFEASFVLISA